MNWTNKAVTLNDLEPWGENPKSIGRSQAARLLEYWAEIGQFQTVAVGPPNGNSKHPVYDGHQRLHVLKAAHGGKFPIDVRVSSRALDDDERAKLVIQAHAGTTGQWDWDALAAWDTDTLQSWGMDADLLQQWNVDAAGLGTMLDSEEEENAGADTEPQIDKAEELRKLWGVELGQMWQLGEHRLICGDCTDKAVVERVMGGEVAALCFTSPPYVDMRTYSGNDISVKSLLPFLGLSAKCSKNIVVNLGIQIKDNEVVEYWNDYIEHAKSEGLKLLSWGVWDRGEAGTIAHNTSYLPIEHEWIFIWGEHKIDVKKTIPLSDATHERRKHHKRTGSGARIVPVRQQDGTFLETTTKEHSAKKIGTVARIPPYKARVGINHPAMFPVDLPERYIKAMSSDFDNIYEPFSGSGTTLMACENLNRRCRAVEIDPGYVAVTLQRWVDHTGKTPELID